MPRRRRGRFTPKKTTKSHGGDPASPTEAEWRSMTEFGSFVVRDEEDVEHIFRKGDDATVLPYKAIVGEELPLHKYWVARIKEIRAKGEDEVWARVQWHWSGHEVAGTIKSFHGASCGNYERIYSDHFDYVSSSAFDAVVHVHKFFETNPNQPYIGKDEFYTRYTFEYKARIINPRPGSGTCVCEEPYSPDDTMGLMHFCPRPSCRHAYHQKCLLAEFKDPESSMTRSLRLLASSPDSDETIVLEDLISSEPPKKKRRGRPAKKSLDPIGVSLEDLLKGMPSGLVLVAQQPIVRGAAFSAGGVSGNVQAVLHARNMVYAALSGTPIPDDWEDNVDIDRAIVRVPGRKPIPAFVCPKCGGAI
ncbi:hypothetical protein BDZ94DRAFT_1259504 [Collybia nuda]|uniref:BAH domain-containing protein n=1 Tax=Collybia nuda TaxID=64659 RepID=A0A9P5Y6M7_9AGAR|nr:hypothetical protein BDZ94DRAFT_1259504 [Collybia nuda]